MSKPYSGKNPIPTIKQFVENLDKDKAERDKQIDQERRGGDGVKAHQNTRKAAKEGTQKTVTDPVTGKQVKIEDVDKNMMKAVEDPHVYTAALYWDLIIC